MPVQRQLPQITKPGRAGDYMPAEECTSVLMHMRVRQARRLESLHRAMKSAIAKGPQAYAATKQQMQAEWKAVLKAKGYGRQFPDWLLGIAHFSHIPCELPAVELLADIMQYVKFDCEAVARAEARQRRARFQLFQELDRKYKSSSSVFSSVKGPPNLPFAGILMSAGPGYSQEGPSPVDVRATCLQDPTEMFRLGPACLDDRPVEVDRIDGDTLFLTGVDAGPGTVLEQHCVAVLPRELRAAFAGQWLPIWQRDGEGEVLNESWPDFCALSKAMPADFPPIQVDMLDVAEWRRTINQMGVKRAVGVCGWSPAELKQMPTRALEQLMRLFDLAVKFDLPPHLLEARISVKNASPKSIAESRPITVF